MRIRRCYQQPAELDLNRCHKDTEELRETMDPQDSGRGGTGKEEDSGQDLSAGPYHQGPSSVGAWPTHKPLQLHRHVRRGTLALVSQFSLCSLLKGRRVPSLPTTRPGPAVGCSAGWRAPHSLCHRRKRAPSFRVWGAEPWPSPAPGGTGTPVILTVPLCTG
jgi:hypothetical protein